MILLLVHETRNQPWEELDACFSVHCGIRARHSLKEVQFFNLRYVMCNKAILKPKLDSLVPTRMIQLLKEPQPIPFYIDSEGSHELMPVTHARRYSVQ